MILYSYKAKNLEGKIHTGQYWCADSYDLARKLRDRELFLLAFSEKKINKIRKRAAAKQLSVLCSYFHSLLSSGISIIEAVEIIEKQSSNKTVKKSLKEILHMLQQGIELSDCMRLYPYIYTNFLVSMIKIGEESGKVDEIFYKLAKIYENEDRIKNKITKALIYPSILLTVSILVIQLMIVFIMPVFLETLTSLKGTLPLLTRMFFLAGNFISRNYLLLTVGISILSILTIYGARAGLGKRLIMSSLMRNTIISKNIGKAMAVKFSKYIGILLSSGVNIVKALDIAETCLKDSYLSELLVHAFKQIRNGVEMSVSLSTISLFPPVLHEMIRIGEASGTLDTALLKASDIMEEELCSFIDKLTVFIEPVLILIISLFIGIMLAAFLLPMISIMDAI